jgi:CheY-like chemotaxis protein
MASSEPFVRELQSALQHLYDPAELRRSPLLTLFAVGKHHNPASALQKILLDAIEALRPGDDVPLHANAWRIYHVLTYRYVEQSSQRTVAINLALSVRQLRRQERAAERRLADYLWERYDVESKGDDLSAAVSQAGDQVVLPDGETPGREQELAWLEESFPSETADIARIIKAGLETVSPFMGNAGVEVECQIPEGLPTVCGQLVAMRQAFLNLLTAAVHAVPGGSMRVTVGTDQRGVIVHVRIADVRVADVRVADGHTTSWPLNGEVIEHLLMARQFLGLFGGALEVIPTQSGEQPFAATLVLPVAQQVPVLMVDDNADTLRLLRRYLTGTRYHFIGTRDPEQVVIIAEESAPRVIVMDVMLPGIEGWELLGRLRTHPKTRDVPIVVCTILPQEQLALSLGAAEFLRKPVSREALLSALDRQIDSQSIKSR